MTEAELRENADLQREMRPFEHRPSARKFYLFNVACCRRIWQLVRDSRSRQLLEVLEQYADYTASDQELLIAYDEARYGGGKGGEAARSAAAHAAADRDLLHHAFRSADDACEAVADEVSPNVPTYSYVAIRPDAKGPGIDAFRLERIEQCRLFRDIFRWHMPIIRPEWLVWNDGTVPKIAEAIYTDRAFDRLPILADALEDAGCTNRDILDHCRQPGEHVRGCWVVDLVLGKE